MSKSRKLIVLALALGFATIGYLIYAQKQVDKKISSMSHDMGINNEEIESMRYILSNSPSGPKQHYWYEDNAYDWYQFAARIGRKGIWEESEEERHTQIEKMIAEVVALDEEAFHSSLLAQALMPDKDQVGPFKLGYFWERCTQYDNEDYGSTPLLSPKRLTNAVMFYYINSLRTSSVLEAFYNEHKKSFFDNVNQYWYKRLLKDEVEELLLYYNLHHNRAGAKEAIDQLEWSSDRSWKNGFWERRTIDGNYKVVYNILKEVKKHYETLKK